MLLLLCRENNRRVRHRDQVYAKCLAWKMEPAGQRTVDRRVAETHAARPDYVRSTFRPFQLTGSIKGADCLRLATEAGLYWFYQGLPPAQQDTWNLGINMLMKLLRATCDYDDPVAIPVLQALKLDTIRALIKWAKGVPDTEHAIIIHELVHVCDCVYRWNSVRNFWAFVTERYHNTQHSLFFFLRMRNSDN